ncbi:MAG: hypothetical protein R3C24_12820 [Cyanobacteriota/Melainabacteria group bacterium]
MAYQSAIARLPGTVRTLTGPTQPLNIWSNESFQDIRSIMQNLGDHFNIKE